MRMRVVVIAWVVAACGSKKQEPPAPACDAIATALIASIPQQGQAKELSKETIAALEKIATTRCTEDKWPADARRCIAKAKGSNENYECWRKHLTPAQQQTAERAINAELEKAVGLRVTGLEPVTGDLEGGTYVVIKGGNFLNDGPRNAKVYFGSRQGTVVRFQSDTELIVQAPGGKRDETVDVLVIFEPGGQLKLPSAFTFVDPTEGVGVEELASPDAAR